MLARGSWWPFATGTGGGHPSRPARASAASGASRPLPDAAAGPCQAAAEGEGKSPKASAARRSAATSSPCRSLPDSDHPGVALPVEIEGGHRLPYPEAAVTFLLWLQRHECTGEMTQMRLACLYAEHCEDLGLAWLPTNNLFRAFADAIGRNRKFTRRIRQKGRERRVATYDVPKTSSVERRAAAA